MLPFFVNKLDGFDAIGGAHVAALQVSLGDVLGVPLLGGKYHSSSPIGAVAGGNTAKRYLWDLVVLSNYMIDVDWLMQTREAGPVLMGRGPTSSSSSSPSPASASRPIGVGGWCRSLVVLSGERDEAGATAVADGLRRHHWADVTFGSQSLGAPSRDGGGDASALADPGVGLREGQACLITPHLPVPFGTHHSKAAVCVHREFIRVAIFTANFVYGDWRTKNQGIYVQDFPLKMQSAGATAVNNSFEYDLVRYFTATGWRGCGVIFGRYDYSQAAVHVVASIPGYHPAYVPPPNATTANPLHSYYWGMWHLRHILRSHCPSTARGDALTWQYSSQGSLTQDFVDALARIMMSQRPMEEGGSPMGFDSLPPSLAAPSLATQRSLSGVGSSAGSGGLQPAGSVASTPSPGPCVSVVMPTIMEVRRSVEGWRGGLSIPVPEKNLFDFINRRLHRWSPRLGESGGWVATPLPDPSSQPSAAGAPPPPPRYAMTTFGRHRYMPHIKTYVRYTSASTANSRAMSRHASGASSNVPSSPHSPTAALPPLPLPSSPSPPDAAMLREADWVLLTSANLSRAAWGDVQKKGAQLMVRSYELGVLYVGGGGSTAGVDWEVKGIGRASDDRGAALSDGLHRIAISGGGGDGNSPQPNRVLYLPYDATSPSPYDSTVAVRQGRPLSDAPRDAPWVVDRHHEGQLDLLGLTYADAALAHSNYGGAADDDRAARVVRCGSDGALPPIRYASTLPAGGAHGASGSGRVLGCGAAGGAAVTAAGAPPTSRSRLLAGVPCAAAADAVAGLDGVGAPPFKAHRPEAGAKPQQQAPTAPSVEVFVIDSDSD